MLHCKIELLFSDAGTIFRRQSLMTPTSRRPIRRDLTGFLRLAAGEKQWFPPANNFRELMFTKRVIIAI